MVDIVGRTREKKELEEAYSSNEAELIAVYGRRRVEKTYLIKNFFQQKKCIYFQTTGIFKASLNKQLLRFTKELGNTFYEGASLQPASNWMEAFEQLTQSVAKIPKNKKIVVFLDELPWLCTRKSGIIQALEYFWNRYWSNDNRIKCVLCGSAASWIIQKIIKNKGGLHNRVTKRLNLKPFDLYETNLYLKHIEYKCTIQQVLKLYMVMGGVPFYLKQLKKKESIEDNICRLFFNAESMFFDEFNEVFTSLFEHSEQHKEILTLVARYKAGIPRSVLDKENKLTGKGGRLTKRLLDLEWAGFISTYIPIGHKKRGVYYRITDEYCYFYLKWMEPMKTMFLQNRVTDYWKQIVDTPAYYAWAGYTFENICYKHILQIKKALNIESYILAAPWWYLPRKEVGEDGAEIDLVFERRDDFIICEIKYTSKPFTIDKYYATKLNQKTEVFKEKTKTNKQIFLGLISAAGIKKNLYSEDLIDKIATLEDLFSK